MQPIQDKKLDQLFKDAFKDAEIAPSKDFWSQINPGNTVEKKNKKLPIMWMAAASVTAILTFALMQKEESMKLSSGEVTPEVVHLAPESVMQNNSVETLAKTEQQPNKSARKFVVNATNTQEQSSSISNQEVKVEAPIKNEPEIYIAQQIVTNEPVNNLPNNEVVYAQVVTPDINISDSDELEETKNNSIRNVGDLVNFVVNKIDKRDNKAIKFKTEDDESSIVGINIGFLKFNAKRK